MSSLLRSLYQPYYKDLGEVVCQTISIAVAQKAGLYALPKRIEEINQRGEISHLTPTMEDVILMFGKSGKYEQQISESTDHFRSIIAPSVLTLCQTEDCDPYRLIDKALATIASGLLESGGAHSHQRHDLYMATQDPLIVLCNSLSTLHAIENAPREQVLEHLGLRIDQRLVRFERNLRAFMSHIFELADCEKSSHDATHTYTTNVLDAIKCVDTGYLESLIC